MNRFDFTPFRRSMVGFDRLFDQLESQTRTHSGDNYPPFNIEKRGDDAYRITLAVAGFKPGDFDITAQQNMLIVQGKKGKREFPSCRHRPARIRTPIRTCRLCASAERRS
jgi:molecular chaperone IbpA